MPKSFQIEIPDAEKSLLLNRIEQDFLLAKSSHLRWSQRCAEWMKKWEGRVNPPAAGDELKPNHVVPLVQWQCFNKLARDVQALLGDDAEITAKATGPSDAAKVAKIGRYMTSRVFDQMQIINPLCIFEFRRILNGWACAYRPWWKREFTTLENGKPKRVCDYEGPGFFPCEPDDVMVPPERGVTSLQDFSYVIRRVRVTVDDLVRGDGTLYQGTSDPAMVQRLVDWAQQGPSNDYTLVGQDPVRTERERSEGVDYDAFMLGRRSLWMWEWYGKWRPLKSKNQQGGENELQRREVFEADWVVKYIPGLREIVGCQDLLQLYPKMRNRRPFVESTLIKDGTYRPKGFGALLEDLEDDATANSRLFQAAGELSVWPIIFFRPGGGMKPGAIRIEPGMAYPTEDPSSVNVVKISPNLEFAVARQQDILSIAERVTGITDQSLGRGVDRPNAPKTATGQLALIEEGNVRAYLDSTILREDMEDVIGEFWELDCDLVPQVEPGLFFRVTEEQANGLFDIRQGGAFMTPKEFGGRYDFRLKFATSIWARAAKKQELLQFASFAMQNPIVAQNPLAMWELTNRLAREFNVTDFSVLVPRPPELDRPKTPDEEWTDLLEGDYVSPNPQDQDQVHLVAHHKQLDAERRDPDRNVQAIGLLVKHILETQQQVRIKQMMSSLTSQLMDKLQPHPGITPEMVQQLQQHIQGGPPGGQFFAPRPPQQQQPGPQAAGPGNIPPPPTPVGSTAAPVPQNGMM
jgi:hypothetical protein